MGIFAAMSNKELKKGYQRIVELEGVLQECLVMEWCTGQPTRWTQENLDLARKTADAMLAEIALRMAEND